MQRFSWCFICLMLAFTLCFVVDNFLEMKVVSLFGLSTTPGLLVIPVSYIAGDAVTEVYGFRVARRMIGITFVAYLGFVGLLQAACLLPPADCWEGEEHFRYVFSMSPRIMVCSMAAFVCGNMTNAWIMARMKERYCRYGFRARAILSTVFGELVDSVVFFVPVFWGRLPPQDIVQMCVVGVVAKTLYEVAVLPVTERVVRYAKRTEGMPA